MNMWYICCLLLLGIGANAAQDTFCEENPSDLFPNPTCYNKACMTAIKDHIEHEFHAAFKYLYMGALFGQYIVERPGMANFFFESASEERSHAIQMMDFLSLRGFNYSKSYTFLNEQLWNLSDQKIVVNEHKSNLTIESALVEALKMEIAVTKKINDVVKKCTDDFYAADIFTNPILEEQHTGMRKLQGAIKTLKDLRIGHPGEEGLYLAEFIFDQKMLKGEL